MDNSDFSNNWSTGYLKYLYLKFQQEYNQGYELLAFEYFFLNNFKINSVSDTKIWMKFNPALVT